ncbi:putative disease resistance RPP13-like protein 1 [Camellia sinensis]|uniref:putative disease resistance RPP13-like protein 1 n=1 Tax=Camellia sinensis TaxID=4442 RepID=UPI001035DEEA|nr:putative disease resistance RPP13-like protein 1 [Camellia sinensis]
MEVVGIFVSPLLKAVINKLLSSDLINLPRQGDVDTSIKKLKKSFEDINDVLADAEEKQISKEAVNKWLKELQHLAYDADDVLDEFATEALRKKLIMAETGADADVGEASTSRKVRRFLLPTCCTGFTPRAISFNFAIGSKIKKINDELQDVTTRIKELGLVKKAIGGTHKPTNAWPRRETTYLLDDPFVCGRDEDKKRIVDLLLRDTLTQNKVDVIPITGMGGIGKTTLAQLICDDNGVKNQFDLKAWVCVPDEFDVTRITKAILESFTLDSCNLTELNALQRKLQDTLAGKKFLLVLDDVWNHEGEKWSSLQSPFRAGAHGSKIIVTTRITTVAQQVGTTEHHDLKELSPDDCWSIFAQHAFKNINISEHPELESIGRHIVAKCGGLPLAARALGGLLQCNQNEHEWKMVLTSNIWDKSYEESRILPSLKLSYHHLPSHLKRCFGYCAIVPKDYEFEEDELVLLWMAEGLIEHPADGKQIEDVGRKYFRELVSRSFFQLSRHNKLLFIMHDLINDLAQAVAGDICFRLENNLEGGKQNKISDKARHSSYVGSQYEGIRKFKAFNDARCLRTFLEFLPSRFFNYKTRYLIHDLLPVLKCLRELRLCYSGIDELPDSIGDLKHLRYLDVSHSRIKKLPDSVVTLYNLQVLFLKFCVEFQKLPLNMGRLVNLRHFDMTGVHIPSSEEMSLHIGKLINLQTLSNFMVGKDCGRKIGELKNLSHIRGAIYISRMENVNGVKDAVDANLMSKEELKELSLEWDESHSSHNDIVERDVLDVMKPFKLLERLTISGYSSTKFPNWVGDVSFSKMTFMQLKGSKCCTSLPPLGQLPLLKDLYIEGMSAIKQLGCEFYGKQHGAKPFPFLETLSFVDMPEWEDWSAFEIEGVQPYHRLSELSIINCPKLVGRLPNDLPCLNSLKIDGCPELLIDVSSLVQPSLAFLSMTNVTLPSLPALLGTKNTIELGSLTLDISHVTVLDSLSNPSTTDEELLANEMSKQLTSITALRISHVEKLVFLPTWFTQDLTRVEKLDISNCQELKTLWRNKVGIQVCLPTLCHLKISHCPNVVCLFEKEQEKRGEGSKKQQHEGLPCMTRLEYLTIEECGMLKILPQDLHTYTSLAVLRIDGCANLMSFPMKGLPSMLRELSISMCNALTSLPELMKVNNLQELRVSYCASITFLLSRGGLPSTLKQLEIGQCENLESLFAEEGIQIDWPSLETICIEFCPNLKSLSRGGRDENSNINQLTSLQKLGLVDCRAEMVSYFVKEGSFPTNITSLEIGRFRVDDVGQLPVPPPSPLEWGLHKLSSLTTLELVGLHGPWGNTVSFPEEGMLLPTSLINLTIWNFRNLERFSYEEFQNLTSLQTLNIRNCPKLASFPKEGLPPSLLHLLILECPELATFPKQGFPPSLLSLAIWGCNPILKQKCEKGKEYWPIIQYIPQVYLEWY